MIKLRRKDFNHLKTSILHKYIVYFICMFIIPSIAVNLVLYQTSKDEIIKETYHSNQLVLNDSVKSVDEILDNIREVMYAYSMNEDLKYLGGETLVDSTYRIGIKRFLAELNAFKLRRSYIHKICAYFNTTDILLADDGQYKFEYFYGKLYKFEDMNFRLWMEYFKHPQNFSIIGSREVQHLESTDINGTVKYTAKKIIIVTTTYPLNAVPKVAISVQIDEDMLFGALKSMAFIPGTKIIVMDGNESIVTQTAEDGFLNLAIPVILENRELGLHKQLIKIIGHDEYIITQVDSKVRNWKYITLVPTNGIIKRVVLLKNITLVINVLFLVISIIFAFLLSSGIYSPIKTILELLNRGGAGEGSKLSRRNDELGVIFHKVQDIYYEKNELELKVNNAKMLVRDNIINIILQGKISDLKSFKNELYIPEDFFENGVYTCCIIHIDLLDILHSQEDITFKEDLKSKVKGAIDALQVDEYSIIKLDLRENDHVMFLRRNYNGPKDSLGDTMECFLNSFFNDYTFIKITIGVGGAYHDIGKLNKSYYEAMKCINNRTMEKGHRLIDYTQIQNTRNQYYYSIIKENNIFNNLLTGQTDEAIKIMEDIIDLNVDKPLEQVKTVIVQCVNIVSNFVIEKGFKVNELIPDIVKLYAYIDHLNEVSEIKRFIAEFYYKAVQEVKDRKKESKTELFEKIREMIQEHFYEEISLKLLADKFDVTIGYISRLFKGNCNMNYIEYVNHVRLEKAKELLIKTDSALYEIALKTGYNSANTFVKIFKRNIGMTPGKYREMYSKQTT